MLANYKRKDLKKGYRSGETHKQGLSKSEKLAIWPKRFLKKVEIFS